MVQRTGFSRLPIHGFVLAGGRSSRMGVDKATLKLGAKTLVEIAVRKLESFCAEEAIAGSREDLASFAHVVPDLRPGSGPAAALEAGLAACTQPWAMFVPVDAPLVPAEMLKLWAMNVLAESSTPQPSISYLRASGQVQPAFCLLRRELASEIAELVAGGDLRLMRLWAKLEERMGPGSVLPVDAEELAALLGADASKTESWFFNANTPEDWARLLAEEAAAPLTSR